MRHRLHFDHWPAAVYAVGDVHGCLAQLLEMERRIIADAATFAGDAKAYSTQAQLEKMLDDPFLDARVRAAQTLLHLSR